MHKCRQPYNQFTGGFASNPTMIARTENGIQKRIDYEKCNELVEDISGERIQCTRLASH